MLNVLTIDVEDWYTSSLALFGAAPSSYGQRPSESVVFTTHRILDLLDEYGQQATFFVLGTVSEHYPDLIREIAHRGHEVATHGYAHRLSYEMTSEELEADVDRAIELTEALSCQKIEGYRAPYFSLTRQSFLAFDILLNKEIRYDSSIFPIHRRLYGDPGAPDYRYVVHSRDEQPLWELPPSTIRFLGRNMPIAGGGYLRLFPYQFVFWGIRSLNRAGKPAVLYIHPYELDPSDVKIGYHSGTTGGRLIKFSQSLGRGAMERKLRRLLSDFTFSSIREVFCF